MPHYKCGACRARLYVPEEPAELVGDLCPECGSLLEPIADLVQLVGFRSIRARDRADGAPESESPQRIADVLDGFVARRTTSLERDRLDAERWLDDRDEVDAAVAAVAVTLASSLPTSQRRTP